MNGDVCDFAVEEFACASVSGWNLSLTTCCCPIGSGLLAVSHNWSAVMSSRSCRVWQQTHWQISWHAIAPWTPAACCQSGSFSYPKLQVCWMNLWTFYPTGWESQFLSWFRSSDECGHRSFTVFVLQSLDSRNPAVSMILDAILEVRLDSLSTNDINNPAVVQLWFNHRLLPFLPSVSTSFLTCLTRRGLNCSAYQQLWV